MDVIKVYHAKWQQNLYNISINEYRDQWVHYFVIYRRKNHLKNENVTTQGFFTNIKYEDEIDLIILNQLNEKLRSIVNIKNFHSQVADSLPLGLFYSEDFEKARMSRLVLGHDFRNLQINNNDLNINYLKTRVMAVDYRNIRDNFINDLPYELDFSSPEDFSTLQREPFLTNAEAEKIIQEYFGEDD